MAGDFDIVADAILRCGDGVVLALEERLLEIPSGSPGQDASDLQVLAEHVADHVPRVNAFGGALVVRAARGVNVMIAGVPTHLRRIDPAFEPESKRLRLRAGHLQ